MKTRAAVVVVAGVVIGTYQAIVTPAGLVTVTTGVVRVAMERQFREAAREALVASSIETTGEAVS